MGIGRLGARKTAPPPSNARASALTERSSSLTERSATALAAAIRAREVSAREVVEAHIEVLEHVNPAVNAIVADCFDAARDRADLADEVIAAAAPGDELPPLLGVPFTIKESIAVAGMPHTAGVVARRNYRAGRTAPVVRRMVDAGAIPLGLTNTSELCMWIETENKLYGRTSNPYDAGRTAGGSSGGEGAAVGAGGAPFGLGTDSGGSIRMPAFCCGVFGHKPSTGLIPLTGTFPVPRGETTRLVVNGPLARRAEDLMPLLRLLSGPDGDDPLCGEPDAVTRLGEPADVRLDGLRVLISEHAWLRPISRELLAARERAAAVLESLGARVEHLPLRAARKMIEPYLAILSEGGSLHDILRAEGSDVGWRATLTRGGEHTRATKMLLIGEPLTNRSPRFRNGMAAGLDFARQFVDTVGDGIVLHPPAPTVAPRHGGTIGRPYWPQPMGLFNLAGMPVTQVPLGLNDRGLPLGVQVAAGPGRDHVSIRVALELERVFGGWTPPGS
ncbi:MAG TPA: amidase [Kribbellaceae bacterium]|nr:amidase [Kribbellaceae bacterium]